MKIFARNNLPATVLNHLPTTEKIIVCGNFNDFKPGYWEKLICDKRINCSFSNQVTFRELNLEDTTETTLFILPQEIYEEMAKKYGVNIDNDICTFSVIPEKRITEYKTPDQFCDCGT